MPDRFGQISAGLTSADENTKQGFLDTEKHLNVLNNKTTLVQDDLEKYKSDLSGEMTSALGGLTSSSSNADIVTALQNMFAKIKGLS